MKKIYSNLENFNSFLPNLSFFFSSNFLTQITSFVIILLFARNYSSVEFGKFTIAQTVFFLIYSVSFSNIHYYLNKSLSQNFQNRRKEIASCFLITFYTSVSLYILLGLSLNFFSLDKDLKYLILIINLILIVEPFSIFYSEIFVRGQFKLIFKIKFIQSILFFSLKYVCIKNDYNYIYISVLYFLEYLFFALIIIYYYKKNGNNFSNLIFNKKETIKILKKVLLLPVLSLIFLVSIRIDVLMIGNLLGVEYSGFYSAASRLVVIVLLYSTLFMQFLYPNISRLNVDSDKFTDLYQNLIASASFVGISFFCIIYFFVEFYLGLFGNKFIIAKEALLILSFNLIFAIIYNIWVHKKFLTNNYSKIFFFHFVIIILNIVLNFYMIELYGIRGAAISTMISGILAFFIVNISSPKEIYLIFSSLKFERFNIIAHKILSLIFSKKKPDKREKSNN
tara:strand:+ start:473 stop:1825 length:1353 start_codon:yes stop_codon:yes gene_type:complete